MSILNEWHWQDEIDIDSLVNETGKSLIRQLTKGQVSLREGPDNIQQLTAKDGLIRVCTFSYRSGGTAGIIYNPVLQWRKKNGSYGATALYPAAKNGFSGLETEFYKIYRLSSSDKNLYLLLGSSRGNRTLLVHQAFVIELNNDAPVLTYPAFLGKYADIGCFDTVSGEDGFVNVDFSEQTY